MEKKAKKPFYKKWWFWVLAFLFLLVMGNLNTGPKEEKQETAPVVQEEPEEAPQEKDPITAIIDAQKFEYSDLSIIENSGLLKISLHYDKTTWDETDFVRECLSDYVDICSEAYEIEGIDKIEYYVFVDLTDSKGNESSNKGFSMYMPKDVFKTYNWENLKYIPGFYKQIESDSEIFIYPGIKNRVDFEKVYYKG